MSGVVFGAKSFNDPELVLSQKSRRTFVLGDNVVLCSHVVLLGPLEICDNVVVGAGSIVTKSIIEPGVYAGVPAKKIGDNSSWLNAAKLL